MEGAIVRNLQKFCDELEKNGTSPNRLKLVNIPKIVDDFYAVEPLDPLLVKDSYIQPKKTATVKFEACSYNSDEDSLSDVSVTCYGSLREKICIPSPDEFSDG